MQTKEDIGHRFDGGLMVDNSACDSQLPYSRKRWLTTATTARSDGGQQHELGSVQLRVRLPITIFAKTREEQAWNSPGTGRSKEMCEIETTCRTRCE